jgi:DNA adenine methylase
MQLLNYPGGKARLAKWIISHFPRHRVYVEPFGGSAAVLLQKPPSEVEVYNDINQNLLNFMKVLRDQPDRLAELIELTNYSDHKDETPTGDPVERARRFFHQSNTCWFTGYFNGQIVNANGGGTLRGAWNHKRRNILPAGKRLSNVTIIGVDAVECVRRHDSPDTLFYVDPPYLGERRADLYEHEMMDPAQHLPLIDALKACRGHVALSGYSTPLYEELFAGWQRHLELVKPRSKESKLEVLWVKPSEAPKLVGMGVPDLFGEHASGPKPTRKSNAAYVKNTLKRAAICPDNGKSLPRGRPKKSAPCAFIQTQEERARRSGISRRTQQKLDRVARMRPDLSTLIAQGRLTISAALRIVSGVPPTRERN